MLQINFLCGRKMEKFGVIIIFASFLLKVNQKKQNHLQKSTFSVQLIEKYLLFSKVI